MDDRIWTTESEYERVSDADAHTLNMEQLRRQLEELSIRQQQRERERRDRERGATAARTAAEVWGQEAIRSRERMIREGNPEPDMKRLLDENILRRISKMARKEATEEKKILKPLPDELFEID